MSSDPNSPQRDPRLEIPEILQKPIGLKPTTGAPVPQPAAGFGELGKALAIGLDFLFTVGAAALLGYLLDRWQGWSPYGLMIGLGVGFLGSSFRIIQRLNRDDRSSKSKPKV